MAASSCPYARWGAAFDLLNPSSIPYPPPQPFVHTQLQFLSRTCLHRLVSTIHSTLDDASSKEAYLKPARTRVPKVTTRLLGTLGRSTAAAFPTHQAPEHDLFTATKNNCILRIHEPTWATPQARYRRSVRRPTPADPQHTNRSPFAIAHRRVVCPQRRLHSTNDRRPW